MNGDFGGQSDLFGADTALGSIIEAGLLLNPITLGPALVGEGISYLFAPDDPSVVGQASDAAAHFVAPESPFSQPFAPDEPAKKPLIPTWFKVTAGITAIGIIGVSGVIVLTGIARKLHLI